MKRRLLQKLQARPELEIAVALLKQSVLAGIGNVFKSEVCFVCGFNPFRNVGSLDRHNLEEIVAASRKLMLANVGETIDQDSGGPLSAVIRRKGYGFTAARASPAGAAAQQSNRESKARMRALRSGARTASLRSTQQP